MFVCFKWVYDKLESIIGSEDKREFNELFDRFNSILEEKEGLGGFGPNNELDSNGEKELEEMFGENEESFDNFNEDSNEMIVKESVESNVN